ncbi:MAG: hypothetical protein RIC38_01260, partial [Chromatocurvus sp.]
MSRYTTKTFNLLAISSLSVLVLGAAHEDEARWWRGNTHTHSWWSDGDAPPETIANWYKSQGYQFLVISDHNVMQRGEKWYPVDKPPRRPDAVSAAFDRYIKQFGEDWVEVRGEPGEREVRLKTLNEFRPLFEESDRFLFINGEVLARVDGPDARYRVRGDELYVRARVISSRRHGNPFAEGDVKMAWTQPIAAHAVAGIRSIHPGEDLAVDEQETIRLLEQ